MINKNEIIKIVESLNYPDTEISILSMKPHINFTEKNRKLSIEFPIPINMVKEKLRDSIFQALGKNILLDHIEITQNIIKHKVKETLKTIKGVKNVIVIASGKGGVGKSTVTTNLAVALSQLGANVGVLDADLYGPSQPTMFDQKNFKPEQKDKKFVPVRTKSGIQMMSIGFLIEENQALIWRGALVSQGLQQLFTLTNWEKLDYLLIDLPPGTGDIQLTLSQKIPVTAAIIITTPQDIALIDAKKAMIMFQKVSIPVLGIVENMSIYQCSRCGHLEDIFGSKGAEKLAQEMNTSVLGRLPIQTSIREMMDAGKPEELFCKNKEIAAIFTDIALKSAIQIAGFKKDYSSVFPSFIVKK